MGVGGRLYIRVYGVVIICLYRGMGELLLKEGGRCDGVKRGGYITFISCITSIL